MKRRLKNSDSTPSAPIDSSRRAALQGVVTIGGLWFLPMIGCGVTPKAETPAPPPPDSGASPQETAMPTEFSLPPLPYAYDALEPHISAQTLKLHHDRHHAGYVKGANAAAAALKAARESGDFKLVDHHSKKLAFHTSGHLLHSLYWENMAPAEKRGKPSPELDKAIRDAFGTLEMLKGQMSAVAKSVEGSGWGILGYSPLDGQLTVLQCENHEKRAVWSVVPLLVVDVWEHAYYLDNQNKRGDYIAGWWNLVNWNDVSARYLKARALEVPIGR